MPDIDLLTLLSDDKTEIRYRPSWNRITGSICGSILLKQIIDLWVEHGRRPFVKFNSPCKHPDYRPGESWQEELGMSRREFEGARDGIATRTRSGVVVADALVSYWVDASHTPHYALNEPLLLENLTALYPASDGPGIQPQFPNVQNAHQLMYKTSISPNVQNVHQQTTSGKSAETLPDVRSEQQIIVVVDHDLDLQKETTTTHSRTCARDEPFIQACLDWIGFVGDGRQEPLTTATALGWAWWVKLNGKRLRGRGSDPVGIAITNWRKPVHLPPGLLKLAQTWLNMTADEQVALLAQAKRYRFGGMYLPECLLYLDIDPQVFKEIYDTTDGHPLPDTLLPDVVDEPDEELVEPPLLPIPENVKRLQVAAWGELKGQMTKATFNTWLKDAQLWVEGQTAVVLCDTDYAADWIQNRLGKTILATLNGVIGQQNGFAPLTAVVARCHLPSGNPQVKDGIITTRRYVLDISKNSKNGNAK